MSVILIPAGGLKEYADGQERIEMAAGPTVTEMLKETGIEPALVAAVLGDDDEMVNLEYRPRDGETLKLIAVMGGG